MAEGTFGTGKLPMDLLEALLARYSRPDKRLVVGPRVGEDAAVLDMGARYLVVKSDPITFATEKIGWYVVHINANDVASMGARPRWFLLTLLLPERGTDRALIESIFSQVSDACDELGAVLCGGHTEVTYGIDRPIAVGLMLGEVEKTNLVRTAGAQVGDRVILTKGIAIEGTAVLAREAGDELAELVDGDIIERGRRFLTDPGISVVRDAEIMRSAARVHAMHDPTEGGLSTGLWEVAKASDKGIEIDLARVPVFAETRVLCSALGLDPLGLIASGALVATVAADDAARAIAALAAQGIAAAAIGTVVEGPPQVYAESEDGPMPVPLFERDELTRVFATIP
jgi:hydrogenase maturation factor